MIAAFGYWGYHVGNNGTMKILLGVMVPLIGFGFWGLVDFHQFGKKAETFRLLQELLVTGLAAFALYKTGMHALGWLLVIVSPIHHVLLYSLGEKLLKDKK